MTEQTNSKPMPVDTNDLTVNGIRMQTLQETVHAIEQ